MIDYWIFRKWRHIHMFFSFLSWLWGCEYPNVFFGYRHYLDLHNASHNILIHDITTKIKVNELVYSLVAMYLFIIREKSSFYKTSPVVERYDYVKCECVCTDSKPFTECNILYEMPWCYFDVSKYICGFFFINNYSSFEGILIENNKNLKQN